MKKLTWFGFLFLICCGGCQPFVAGSGDDDNDQCPACAEQDSDGDGLSNSSEEYLGTDPLSADTDEDGWSDGDEVLAGTDPLDPGDMPSEGFDPGMAIDRDNDGWSLAGDNPDCADNNPSIHPGALETCNDLDDDCDSQVDEGCDEPTPTPTPVPGGLAAESADKLIVLVSGLTSGQTYWLDVELVTNMTYLGTAWYENFVSAIADDHGLAKFVIAQADSERYGVSINSVDGIRFDVDYSGGNLCEGYQNTAQFQLTSEVWFMGVEYGVTTYSISWTDSQGSHQGCSGLADLR